MKILSIPLISLTERKHFEHTFERKPQQSALKSKGCNAIAY